MSDKDERATLLRELLIKMGLTSDKYYGKLIFNFQSGKIINYEKRQTGKLTE